MLNLWMLVVVALSGFSGSVACCSVWTETHLIPQGYVGPVVVLYGAVAGLDKTNAGQELTTIAIGNDGTARIAGAGPREGLVRQRFYYVDSELNRTEIKSSGAVDEFQAFGLQVGNIPEKDIRWVSYFVGTPTDYPDLDGLRRRAVETAIGIDGLLEIPSSAGP